MTPFFWGFEEREKLMEFYERVCGARFHAILYVLEEWHRICLLGLLKICFCLLKVFRIGLMRLMNC